MDIVLNEQRKLALIEEISAAFDGVSREGGVSLSESWIIDDYGSEEERAEARKQDTEVRWQDVPDMGICYGYSCLSFLDDIGFHYYVPAYIVWCLRNMDDEAPEAPILDSMTLESLISSLGGRPGKLDEYHLSRYKRFTPAQSKAVAHFLKYMEEREDVWGVEMERLRQETMAKAGHTQQEIDAAWAAGEKYRREHDLPENDSRRALGNYWAQYL